MEKTPVNEALQTLGDLAGNGPTAFASIDPGRLAEHLGCRAMDVMRQLGKHILDGDVELVQARDVPKRDHVMLILTNQGRRHLGLRPIQVP